MWKIARPVIFLAFTAALCACAPDTFRRYEVEGNSTGGFIPRQLVSGNNAQALADKFCSQYSGRVAKITSDTTASGGSVVFICLDPKAAATPPPAENPPQSPPPVQGGPPRKR